MKYRILKDTSDGHKRGQIVDGSDLQDYAIEPLLRKKVIARVAFPPLVILPGWSQRAGRLARLGVVGVGDLLEADTEELAAGLRIRPATLDRWRDEALTAAEIKIEEKFSKPGCRRNR